MSSCKHQSCDSEKPGIWAKACDDLDGSEGGGGACYLRTVDTYTNKDREKGNSMIGYVIGISMPDAEI